MVKFMKLPGYIILLVFAALFVQSCGTSTGSRYEKPKEKVKKTEQKQFDESLDLGNLKEKVELADEHKKISSKQPVDVWYKYDLKNSETSNKVRNKVNGYRVQVFISDDLDAANKVRSEIYFKTNLKNVYLEFDPPFYKVRAGDFTDIREAKNLSFKLNQLGYKEATVVNDIVNVF